MLLLGAARRVIEGDALVRSGAWRGWAPKQLLGLDVSGRTLGIIGMGRIGRAVAARAKGFGMRLLYHNRSRDEEAETALDASYRELHDLLRESDFVSVHAPLTDETRYLVGEAELGMMKPTAVLVNTSRGPLVDERALERFLRERRIWGAGLDVFENEPELSPGLRDLPNVVLAPHTGSATTGTREAMGRLCAEAIIAVLKGERVSHLLNPEVVELIRRTSQDAKGYLFIDGVPRIKRDALANSGRLGFKVRHAAPVVGARGQTEPPGDGLRDA